MTNIDLSSWPHEHLTRRSVLRASGAIAVGIASLSGCDLSTDPTSGGDSGTSGADNAPEAPALAELVQAGDLPPVEQRLPESPLVVEPFQEVGSYGGTWRTAVQGAADNPWLARTLGYDPLMRFAPDGESVILNVAEKVEQSADATEITIKLRRGMKWSDGAPFTADDLMFAYHDIFANSEITPVFPSSLSSQGEPLEMEKVDEVTVLIRFPQPNGMFVDRLALGTGNDLVLRPRHYLEQFHIEYNPDAEQIADDERRADWVELIQFKMDVWQNTDLPTLRAWQIGTALGESERVVAERNPYYWKIDTEGSQLPYLDRVVYEVISDSEVILLKATSGEIDFHTRHINTLPNKPILADSREDGGYDFNDLLNTLSNEMVIALNLAHEDPGLREVFQNRDFRIGLSHAINRQELIDGVFQRQGEPHQAAPIPQSEFYDEEFATQYLEYDVDLANEHLDRAGLTERDNNGFRLRFDGEPLVFDIEIATPSLVPFWVDATELVIAYWEEVGVRARTKNEDRSLFYERKEANQHDANVWVGDGGFGDEIHEARWYFPFSTESNYAVPWATWFTSRGTEGEEPPEAPQRQIELYRELEMAPEEDERMRIFRDILAIAKEEFYVIGTVRVAETYGIKRNDFRNVPEVMPESARFNTPGLTRPEQYYIDE